MMTEMERPSQPTPAPAVVRAKVLLLEDDDMLAGLLARVLRTDGYTVDVLDCADDLPTGPKLAAFDIVLSDIHLANNTSGHDVLKRVREAAPQMPVILMTAYADIEGAMSAVSHGAYDYLPKPIEPTELKRMVGEAVARRMLAAQVKTPSDPREIAAGESKIVGAAPAMIDLYKTVAHVAPTTATVLIIGESGTGKELVARQIHETSPRANKPFVAVNCAALPESILESELFGHERGAFTGATGLKRGVFEEATGGTLFLDEMGDITPKMQVQLLRVLQEGEIRRVGSSETVKVDVRVVAATNRDLKTDVASGRFREDLYFRLQVVTVRVPPLRERKQDIPLLLRHFLARHADRLKRPVPNVAPEVLEALEAYSFPGNVREMSHLVERAMLLAREGVITAADLPKEMTQTWTDATASNAQGSLSDDWPTLGVLERRYIDRVLSRTGGNKTRAAEVLGIDRRTLNRMFARERAAAAIARGEAPPPETDDDDDAS
jgi:two-component system response regulator AtoC